MNTDILIKYEDIEGNENFARSLGITEEREAEIDGILDESYEETNTFPAALAAASAKLDNANELAYASFHLGAFAESRRAKYELLHKFLGEE